MALWSRKLDRFKLNLEWRGGSKVFVTAEGDGDIDVVETPNGSSDPGAIGRLMKKLEDEMDEAATAMA